MKSNATVELGISLSLFVVQLINRIPTSSIEIRFFMSEIDWVINAVIC